jgi:hypothetical protein
VIALRLVRLIEDHSAELVEDFLEKLRTSEKTRDMAKVPVQELRDRVHEILKNLGDWLLYKKEADIQNRYREIGMRRAAQQVSLSDYCWAVIFTKEHILDFLQREGMLRGPLEIYGELELIRLLDQFFDRALCYATEGYESAAASSA